MWRVASLITNGLDRCSVAPRTTVHSPCSALTRSLRCRSPWPFHCPVPLSDSVAFALCPRVCSPCVAAMSSNVIVAVRIRPANSTEQAADTHRPILQRINSHALRFDPDAFAGRALPPGSRRAKDLSYRFDHVFGPEASQEEVYAATAGKCIDKVVAGFNATIFGQTAAGNTEGGRRNWDMHRDATR